MASAHVILKYLNQTKIKGGCQMGRKMVPHDSKSDLPLVLLGPGLRPATYIFLDALHPLFAQA